MDKELFSKLASKIGITSVKVLSQAEEYMRLSQVKCVGLGSVTATSKAIICLELAATSMKFPVDKEYAIKLSGLSPKVYSSNLKSMECMLGLQSSLGLRDLAVQYGCLEAVKVASQILERYETSLPAAKQQDLDLSKSLFTTAALYAACKCMKIKTDRKLASSSGAKKGIFDRLCTQFQKFGQEICKEASSVEKPVKTAQKRQNSLAEMLETAEDDGKIATSPKQERVEKTEEEETQIYEEWKRKILENALKAKAVDS
ncbi:origin recognition complex subunit 6 [Rhinichthys klamathensis goyatoka]|uniref:origin recognition complex subunit 6 n=1 Tax=Rhinichthys klamathensis goyatoka TaxID=3034132 RepID=UPI0024B4C627|nr:origin recognition complex subunit 6 [Rhinichthys klamathensis goyatoka]